jgi:hypothetical protein
MVMAIRRCPYCKAIIDGVAEYCSNCGTQLLFPEDEFKEEEIPGDKIVEEEEKEEETLGAKGEELEKEEPSPESEEEEEGKEEETLEAKEEELEKDEEGKEEGVEEAKEEEDKEEENEEREELEKAVTPPQVEEIDIKAAETPKMKEARELVKKETEKLWASVGTGDVERSPDVDIEFPMPPEEEKEEIEATPPPGEEINLRSIRLRRTPDSEEREKEEIDKFVESVKAERGKEAQPSEEEIPPSEEIEMEERDLRNIRMGRTPDTEKREKVEIERFVESIKKERERVKEYLTPEEEIPPPPKEMGKETSEIKERIPPWAEKIKEEPPQELEDKKEEREKEKTAELGQDFQEKEMKTPVDESPPPTDEPLPKEDKPPPTDEPLSPVDEPLSPIDKPILSEKEIGFPEEVDLKVPFAREIREKRKRAVRRRRSGYYAWLKARVFDFVFIAASSLICLGLASRLMEVSLFRLISVSGPPVLVLYFVLMLFYFGFFILFLGETPGDRLFPRD